MKILYLLRHAKSSWDDPDISDFDRPLNERGNKSAPLMGKMMAKRSFIPDIVISSPANRAKSTAELVMKAAGASPVMVFDEQIYEASPQTLLRVIADIDDQYDSAMVVGHNPGMEGLVRCLTSNLTPMPTAALAVIALDATSWKDAGGQSGKLVEAIKPKDLKDS